MADELYCPAGTIYDPSTKLCNFTLRDIAAQQQLVITNARSRGASSIISGVSSPSGGIVGQGKYSFDSNPTSPPWVSMPDGGFPFSANGTVNLPVAGTGFTDVIGPNGQYVMQVPNGNDGVITLITCFYNGPGFNSGSGQLVWRILLDGQAVRNYDNILVQLGVAPFPGTTEGIRITSGQSVQLQVNNISLVAGGTQIFGFLGGWYYPNKLS